MAKALPIKHIGIMRALCDRRRKANLRSDLGADRYRQLGVKERFRGEEPYRICPSCIKCASDWRFLTWGKSRKPPVRRVGGRVP